MSEITMKDTTVNRIVERSRQKGYKTPEEYLLDLVEADEADDQDETPEALARDFKQSFKDALQGKFLSKEEYQRARAKRD